MLRISKIKFNVKTQTGGNHSSSIASRKLNPLFNKILIANRGEIACRVIKTCKKLGIKTVAVYSEADVDSKHVSLADEAYLLGPPEAKKSYLLQDKMIKIAQQSGSEAIHPGYGFLSENANFSELCTKNRITFIGPPPFAITSMGSKRESKILMQKANVPVVPGYWQEEQNEQFLLSEADKIGYPVLIKAVHGGGGKGMKIVQQRENFIEQLQMAKREASNYFINDKVLLEKYLMKPRHVEIQIFGDTLGNYVYLFERDCSVQRRHQKVIEEAPAPGMSNSMRKMMGEKAVAAARAVQYVGAGTCEFILDTETNIFYFMEMNTRLQVEHPVTEMITGMDLVEWQLQVASGNPLPKMQEELSIHGHCFEARVYSENPKNDFLPVTGQLKYLKPPEEVPNEVRVESGVRQGDNVSIYYDPMIAKLVVWGKTRDEALRRLKLNLDNYHIVGLSNNIEFLKKVTTHKEFIEGGVDTNFIAKNAADLFPKQVLCPNALLMTAATVVLRAEHQASIKSFGLTGFLIKNAIGNPWSQLGGFRLNHLNEVVINLEDGEGSKHAVRILIQDKNTLRLSSPSINDKGEEVTVTSKSYDAATNEVVLFIDGAKQNGTVVFLDDSSSVTTFTNGATYEFKLAEIKLHSDSGDEGAASLRSPMPGKIIQVLVKPGESVAKGKTLMIVEAMKMEHSIKAPHAGIVKNIHFKPGDMVQKGDSLIDVEQQQQQQK